MLQPTMPVDGKFSLIALPYESDALAPVISADTLAYHHGKHLVAYVNNLNAALAGTEFENLSLESVVANATLPAIANNAGQLLNHNLYFTQLAAPVADNRPKGGLAALIDAKFGSFEAFKSEFVRAGVSLFGSGWVWLSVDQEGELIITQEPNAGNPLRSGRTPLLTLDVWEHAYYLDYQNRRADHLSAMWQIIDWSAVAARL